MPIRQVFFRITNKERLMSSVPGAGLLGALSQGVTFPSYSVPDIDTEEHLLAKSVMEGTPEDYGYDVVDIATIREHNSLTPALVQYEPDLSIQKEVEVATKRKELDLERFTTQLIVDQQGFEAAATAFRTMDEMSGWVINEMV